jgi:fatty acid desaturase
MHINNNTSSGGIGFAGLLAILFIALKLTGFITWSWLWVLSPLWLPIAVVGLVILVGLIFALISEIKS